ncbi:MAG: transposase, partial [Bacteroidota bacterium]
MKATELQMLRKQYTQGELEGAVQAYVNGAKMRVVKARYSRVPERTVRLHAKKRREGGQIKKAGRPTKFSKDIEEDIVEWVKAMQAIGSPVTRTMILDKANQIHHATFGITRSVGSLTSGWLDRFLNRNPILSMRYAQKISKARNEVTVDRLRVFFWELSKHIVERNFSADRVFNMDETAFSKSGSNSRVIAVRGSKNIWCKSAEPPFHLTLVASVGADGRVVPPLFILPGLRLNRDVLDACPIEKAAVTTASKGFMTSSVFRKWLEHFNSNVPQTVRRPLLLIYDGCSSHWNAEIVQKALDLSIILVLLPANATHLLQPLDVAIFKPFKTALRHQLLLFNYEQNSTHLTKKIAIQIGSRA